MSADVLVRAAARLSPRMAAYQLKRLVRNKAVPMIASSYSRTVRATAARLPSPTACDQIPLDLANFIGTFYYHTEDEMNGAADGRFTSLGRTVDFGSIAAINWSHKVVDETDCFLWRMKLAQLSILHSLVVSNEPAHQETALTLLRVFISRRTFASADAFATGWSPYDTSHRLLAILSSLSIIAQKGSITPDARAELEAFAQLDAGFLWRNIEHEMRNNHTERNLAALCLYHLAAGSISPRRAKGLNRDVYQIIRLTVLPDGTQAERSAMYQGLTVMSLRIFAACGFLSAATRALARDRADAAARAWLFLTHTDGEIALFNDSWVGEVPSPASILDLSITPPCALPDAGYFRLASGNVDAILDAGEIGLRWNPAHGHPDFLALEVDVEGRRFVVDPGTSQYSTGPQRDYERSSASHNGPHYPGVEFVEYSGRFKVGKLHRAVPLPASELSQLSVPSIGGQIRSSVGSCTRVVCALPSGGLLVVDRWRSPRLIGATNILIPREWRIDTVSPTVMIAQLSNAQTTLAVYQGQLKAVEERTWSRQYFETEQAVSITLEPENDGSGIQHLVYGIGAVDTSEVHAIRAEVGRIKKS